MVALGARILLPALAVLVLASRGTVASPVDLPPVEGSVPDLVAKLAPDRPDPVRLQAVLLLGQLGGDEGLKAVARALVEDRYPPVRSGAALALGQSGDVRWVRALADAATDASPLVQKAARVAIKSLAQGFRVEGGRATYHVDVRGLRDRTGRDDNDLTVWFQEGVAERLAREPGVTLGDVLDFDLGDGEPLPALAGLVELRVDGGVLEYDLQRAAEGTRVVLRGEMQLFLEPVHEPVSERLEARREELLAADVSDEEAIEATVLPLSRELFEALWTGLVSNRRAAEGREP